MNGNRIAGAIDIGGTKTMVGIVESSGRILASKRFPTVTEEGPERHIERCAELLERCLRSSGLEESELCGIGVTVPGLADSSNGVLIHAPYAGWKNVEVTKMLRTRWREIPVRVANDVNACALAEGYYFPERDLQNFLWVTISTGIGGGLVLGGEIFNGPTGIAGEIGHFVVEWEHGDPCGCGNKGCLEAHASGIAIAKKARQLIESGGAGSELNGFFKSHHLDITAENIAKAAHQSIDSAVDIFKNAGTYIGRAFSYAINLLDLDAVIIGGGVSESFNLLEPHIVKAVRCSIIRSGDRYVPIEKTKLGYEAAFLGAASLVFSEIEPKE